MNIQTIFRAGNSDVVAIPKNIARELNLKTGQEVSVERIDEETIVIKKTSTPPRRSEAEFNKWLEVFMQENGEILDELAER